MSRPRSIALPCALLAAIALIATAALAAPATAEDAQVQVQGDCPGAVLENWVGTGTIACPCFAVGERAGAVFEAPPEDYPLEIISVGIVWSSQFGGTPPRTEESIDLHAGGLPNPGAPVASLADPTLVDGDFNNFDFTGATGDRIVESGPFTITLQFRNANAGDIFAPSVIHDAAGCLDDRNVVFAIPGGWFDACDLGVSGNWYFRVSYATVCTCADDLDGDGLVDVSDLLILLAAWGTPDGDVTGDGTTDVSDLLNVIAGWGPC